MRLRRTKLAIAGLVVAAAAAGCGSSSSGGSGGGASVSQKQQVASVADTSTIFDAKIAAAAGKLPAVKVNVGGGHTITFTKGEPLKIAYVGYGLGFDYTLPQYTEAKALAKQYGIQLSTFDSGGDGQKQVGELQSILASHKYNTVIGYPDAVDLTCSLLSKQLPAANMLVISHTQASCTGPESTPGILTTVWDTSESHTDTSWAQHILADAKTGKAIVITGPVGDTSSDQAVAALKQAFAGKIKILAVERTDYTTPGAQQKAQDALQANQDATMIVTTFPEGTRGSITAARIAGQAGKIKIYDDGGAKNAISQIPTGFVTASTPYYPATVVKTAIQAAVLARAGMHVPSLILNAGVENLQSGAAPWITKANASSFQPQY
jgi:ABC-type sugar transport system substrate-binding protein